MEAHPRSFVFSSIASAIRYMANESASKTVSFQESFNFASYFATCGHLRPHSYYSSHTLTFINSCQCNCWSFPLRKLSTDAQALNSLSSVTYTLSHIHCMQAPQAVCTVSSTSFSISSLACGFPQDPWKNSPPTILLLSSHSWSTSHTTPNTKIYSLYVLFFRIFNI